MDLSMSRLHECSACQIGDHKRHRKVVQSVSKGMIGGVICPCKGECKDKTYEDKCRSLGLSARIIDLLAGRIPYKKEEPTEKGMIAPGYCQVSSNLPPDTLKVIKEACDRMNVELVLIDADA